MKNNEKQNEFQKKLALKIKDRRKKLNLTYADISRITGLNSSTLLRYENGDIKNIPANKIELLSDVLKISPIELMGWETKDLNYLSEDEKNIIDNFRKFNSNGKDKIIEYVNDISLISKYKNIQIYERSNLCETPINIRQTRSNNQDSENE